MTDWKNLYECQEIQLATAQQRVRELERRLKIIAELAEDSCLHEQEFRDYIKDYSTHGGCQCDSCAHVAAFVLQTRTRCTVEERAVLTAWAALQLKHLQRLAQDEGIAVVDVAIAEIERREALADGAGRSI